MVQGKARVAPHYGESADMLGIFGAGRNGSTLLMRLLDGSPGLWVYPLELNYLSSFAPRSFRGRVKRVLGRLVSGTALADRWRERYVTAFVRWAAYQLDELNRTYVKQLADSIAINGDPVQTIRRNLSGSLSADLLAFLQAMRSAYDDRVTGTAPLLVFKSIEVAEIPRYQALFPEMRFVHIVRHPYTNYESLKRTDMVRKRKPFWFQGGDILRTQLEARWIPHARFILRECGDGGDRHFLVKYEELCDRPETIVKDICSWLGVAPPAEPALQTVLGGRRMKELPVNPSQEGVETPVRVVGNMARRFGYEAVLTEREREWILARTHRLARQLGYFSAEEEVTLPSRLGLLLKWLPPDRWELMNSDSKIRLAAALVARRFYVASRLLVPFW